MPDIFPLLSPQDPEPLQSTKRRQLIGFGLSCGVLASGLNLSGCSTVTPKKPVIGLVLGAGAARGFAHIGVIKALEAQGIQPDIVVGSSAGSVIAALFASGATGNDLNRLALTLDEATIADWGLPFAGRFGGLIKGEALQGMVNREVRNKSIEQMRIPLGIVATELQSGKGVMFRSGNTGLAVRASCSIPGVFQPAVISGKEYIDGGLVAPVPVSYARQMGATLVIAVNISSEPLHQDASGTFGVLQQTISIMQRSINQYELKSADIVITPHLMQMSSGDFKSRNAAILAGEVAAQEQMSLIKEKLKTFS
ncbi:NTE family protein [Polynucleobacter meluiroseus]|uniref:NTE family protein n=1 Tax=Polynucleobacter meluiroseus TaxID=1938814 RepID=A0A240E385_9BURK|nr:patatin-like phospholipase family protein [Polynucleobacter meluiroseus]SNX29340.1 NTE family protein [Polynucleobacter meluiroseus]